MLPETEFPELNLQPPVWDGINQLYAPPKYSLYFDDIIILINLAKSKGKINLETIFRYLSIPDNLLASEDLAVLIVSRAREYVNRIPRLSVITFLQTYYMTIKGDVSRFIIFMCMYLALMGRYGAMMDNSGVFIMVMFAEDYNRYVTELQGELGL